MCFRSTLYNQKVNKENIKKLISLIIEGSGDNHARDGLKGTPERVANLYEELFSGYKTKGNIVGSLPNVGADEAFGSAGVSTVEYTPHASMIPGDTDVFYYKTVDAQSSPQTSSLTQGKVTVTIA